MTHSESGGELVTEQGPERRPLNFLFLHSSSHCVSAAVIRSVRMTAAVAMKVLTANVYPVPAACQELFSVLYMDTLAPPYDSP